MSEDAARKQWLHAEMGISEEVVESRKRAAPCSEGGVDEDLLSNMISRWEHLEEGNKIPSSLMDKIAIISSNKIEEAKETAKQVRAVRTNYVDDLRLWLQLMPPQRYREWLDKNGYGDVTTDTPLCFINGVRIMNGCSSLRASLPFWRGDKLTRDAGVSDWLTVVHIPHPGLSAASIFIADKESGKGYVIDPILDVNLYLKLAHKESVTISSVLLTHTVIDTLSGHAALQRETCCSIITGKSSDQSSFDSTTVTGDHKIKLSKDNCWIQCWSTPGYTDDSVSYSIVADNVPVALFPGCSLLMDTVGRIDCEYEAAEHQDKDSKETILRTSAEQLFDSLSLLVKNFSSDEINTSNCVVFPARVGMMFCAHTVEPKLCCRWRLLLESNHPLGLIPGHKRSAKDSGKEAFLSHVLPLYDGKSIKIPFPTTFKKFYSDNKRGYIGVKPLQQNPEVMTLCEKMKSGWSWDSTKARHGLLYHLSPGKTEETDVELCPLLLDIRSQDDYSRGYIKGSLSIPMLDSIRFEAFCASLIERHSKLKIICGVSSHGQVKEGISRLSTTGLLDFVISFLILPSPGNHQYSLSPLERISSYDDTVLLSSEELLDIRSSVEYSAQAIQDVKHVPLEDLKRLITTDSTEQFKEIKQIITYCAGGYRSFIATSILNAFDIRSTDVTGGGLTLMTFRPDLWTLRDPQIKCSS